MPTTDWSDLNRDGRRLESIIKHCYTKFKKEKDPILALAYVDRINKTTQNKAEIAKIVLRVREIIKDAEKNKIIHRT